MSRKSLKEMLKEMTPEQRTKLIEAAKRLEGTTQTSVMHTPEDLERAKALGIVDK